MELDWRLPYSSRRVPVFAHNVVATSQPLAAQAGLDALRKGGNAVDAALATAITLTVVEPNSNGIGSDAFAIIWDGERIHGINGSGRSPASWTREKFTTPEQFEIGWHSITVPGAVDVWATLSRRFGALPFADLFDAAIHYARHGYALGPTVHHSWCDAVNRYTEFSGFKRAFAPDGRAPRVGELFSLPEQADTLNRIAKSEGEAFYRGDLAHHMVDYLNTNGCEISLEDLSSHHSEWVAPIGIEYADVSLLEIPPNGQGIAALLALGILEQLALKEYPLDSADSVHLQIEATKAGLYMAQSHVTDPDHMAITADQFLDPEAIRKFADRISLAHVLRYDALPDSGGTVYLTTADASGMMVSYIQSNYSGFGSGIVVPDTGISLQNRASGFTLDQHHPNCVDGSKRPFHTIIPGFVMRNGVPQMSFGVMGGHMQAQGHVQMMTRIFTYGQNPQAASDAPRWYVDRDGDMVFEPGFDRAVAKELVEVRGHKLSASPPQFSYGGAQLIYRLDNGVYCAASDHRKDGQAIGF